MKLDITFSLIFFAFQLNLSTANFEEKVEKIRNKQALYSILKRKLLQEEKEVEHKNFKLDKKTILANKYLQHLKWKTLQDHFPSSHPTIIPISNLLQKVPHLKLYHLLKAMPKGAILHTHENHQVSKQKLLEIVLASNHSSHLYMAPIQDNNNNDEDNNNNDEDNNDEDINDTDNNHKKRHTNNHNSPNKWKVFISYEDTEEDGRINVEKALKAEIFTLEEIAERMTMIGRLKEDGLETTHETDSKARWSLARDAFSSGSSKLLRHADIKRRYLEVMCEEGLKEGVIYIEARKSTSNMHRDMKISEEVLKHFQQKHKNFVGLRRIYYSKKTDSHKKVEKNFKMVVDGYKKHPHHVVGYDVVSEEDSGVGFEKHLATFLDLSTIKTDFQGRKQIKSSVPFFLHAAETNWDENFHLEGINSKDDVIPRVNNLYFSVLMGSKRIGHGLGFWKHPRLMEILKQNKIPIEICVLSNKLLGYTPDLREHPGQLFLKQGIPITLSPDDPGLFGYNDFTLDWFMTFMSWSGLELRHLHDFALNSLVYSGLDDVEKKEVIEKIFNPSWEEYMDKLVHEACITRHSKPSKIEKVFPDHVMSSTNTTIDLYSFDLHQTMCSPIKCSYRARNCSDINLPSHSIEVPATYHHHQHISCPFFNIFHHSSANHHSTSHKSTYHHPKHHHLPNHSGCKLKLEVYYETSSDSGRKIWNEIPNQNEITLIIDSNHSKSEKFSVSNSVLGKFNLFHIIFSQALCIFVFQRPVL